MKELDVIDILVHAGASLGMTLVFLFVPQPIVSALAVTVIWYMYEVGQRIVKEEGGFLKWWNPLKWSLQAKLEFAVPALAAVLVTIVYFLI